MSHIPIETTDTDDSELIKQLLKELEPENLARLSDEEILALRNKVNPYGRTIEGSDKFLVFSYTDLRSEYLKKFHMTAMIGFLNRMCDEWNVPDGIKVVPVDEFVKNPSLLDIPDTMAQDAKEDSLKNYKMMQKRVVVKEFLDAMFQYNPDKHVRSAYIPNPKDPERKVLDTPAAKLAIQKQKKVNPSFKESMRQAEQKLKLEEIRRNVALQAGKKPADKPVSQLTETVTKIIPSADTFHRYQFYTEVNYEELRSAVCDLYCEKPDLETAVNPYDMFESEEQANSFIKKHKDEVITKVYKAQTGKWNIFGNFKQVRNNMQFDNKDTEILDEIFRVRESEEKMGRLMMEKRKNNKKTENIIKDGPDAENFAKWRAQESTLKNTAVVNPTQSQVSEDCPDDAVQVDVFTMDHARGAFSKTHFFTEGEAPALPGDDMKDAPDWAKKVQNGLDAVNK